MARLRGAVTVIVGIQPDVAFAIVKLGMTSTSTPRSTSRRDSRYLEAMTSGKRAGGSALDVL